jgi:hypothetical protein
MGEVELGKPLPEQSARSARVALNELSVGLAVAREHGSCARHRPIRADVRRLALECLWRELAKESVDRLVQEARVSVAHRLEQALDGAQRDRVRLCPREQSAEKATQASLGFFFGCARTLDTSVWCWGTNYPGVWPGVHFPDKIEELGVGRFPSCALSWSAYCHWRSPMTLSHNKTSRILARSGSPR